MQRKEAKVGIKKEKGYLYFVDKQGDIGRAKMSRANDKAPKGRQEKVLKVGVKKDNNRLYFIDKQGDISRAKMVRGGPKRRRRR